MTNRDLAVKTLSVNPVSRRSKAPDNVPLPNRVLFTFVGSHDPFRGDGPASGDGPVLSLLNQERFDAVHLFYNNDEFLRRASDLLKALSARNSETVVAYESIAALDPTDYETLYDQMQHRCLELRKQYGEQTEIWIATSSGTPQMATCWLLLVLGGVVRARLVQGIPPHKLKPGEPVFREIRPTQQRFPRILPPDRLRRELSIATREVELLRAERTAQRLDTAKGIVGNSAAIKGAIRQAKQFAAYEMPVLLLGETGTGKEEFARLIHFSSSRAEKPFVPLNCASLPGDLAESELFGHVKGAFTGATQVKPGIFGVANEGTVFLDEIGELPPAVQAKLLRVLENGGYRPVGATVEKSTKARIIAATHRDLGGMIAAGSFREDLLYRLNTAEVRLPSLGERREDIASLAEHFLEKFCERHRRTLRFEPAVLTALESADWPGNVRSLKHTVERLAVLASAEIIRAKDLVLPSSRPRRVKEAPVVSVPNEPINLTEILQTWEREMMEEAIARFQGNRSAAARHLGYEEPTFRKKCREYFGRKT
jgi:DNA-binding NtrC family response regulator